MNVVLNRTVVVDSDWHFNNLCGSHLQSQSELYHVSWWYYTLVIDLIGQLCHNVIGRLSVKPWGYWLWLLVCCKDPIKKLLFHQFLLFQYYRYLKDTDIFNTSFDLTSISIHCTTIFSLQCLTSSTYLHPHAVSIFFSSTLSNDSDKKESTGLSTTLLIGWNIKFYEVFTKYDGY